MWRKKVIFAAAKNKYFINLETERYAERDFIDNW